ncbi:MAG TPA: alanine--tRNA ligase, partial [Bacteroidales bacterium]|nr:alanine--tRNA ligase [Bacteroidales bacterium]
EFFRGKSHEIVSSAPMVIKNDPTLMFTNAGMNQFKDIFLGNAPVKYKRVADTQKCLRVSGKHNDLEEVGHDGYHHTMFEMLGNWSFGDYFKKEAISWAWEFLTGVMHIDKNRIYVTIFEGDTSENLEKDNEAYGYWSEWIDESRILNGNKKDNFWEMGDTGPCGPCSEIHVDLRNEKERRSRDGKDLVNKSDPRVIEIWNLVFIQYNRKASGELEPLPNKHIDTGMGFERLCMVIQNKTSNYDTDVFQPVISEISALTGIKYGYSEKTDVAMRVVADHLRAVTFAIADGQLPSNAKAGYVIRRILRRAVRYNYTFLNQNKPVIYRLLPALIESLGNAFPELQNQRQLIEKVVFEEEHSFLRTLESGDKRLKEYITSLKKGQTELGGKIAFELYDTYGFPLDLTELILKENDLTVNRTEFDREMAEQRNRSKSAAQTESDDWIVIRNDSQQTEFLGYEQLRADVRINRFRKVSQKDKHFYHMVFDRTPFYAESGGQVGDVGYIDDGDEKIKIRNTFKEHGLVIHVADKLPKDTTAVLEAVVTEKIREATARNHTATHLLHHALREVLGKHVEQKGSLVNAEYLRFDFSHFQKMSDDEMARVESIVNFRIRENIKSNILNDVPVDEAMKMGAMALFGEKYGDRVRVVRFDDSVELCGGTHVDSTGSIGLFKITAESSIAAGIRRIEAITGEKAEKWYLQLEADFKSMQQLLNNPQNPVKALNSLIEEKNSLEKKVEQFGRESARIFKLQLISGMISTNVMSVIKAVAPEPVNDPAIIKDIAFQLKNEIKNLFLVIGAVSDGKPFLAIAISDKLIEERKLNAGEIVREAAKEFNGGGGGQPFYANAGGKDPERLQQAMDRAVKIAESK